MPMNEIGDSLAGFAGVLAFLWIIVTVLLQNRDLKLQYEEIKDMKLASESQARSLRSAEIFKALEYIEFKFERVSPLIEECKGRIDNEIEEFIRSYETGRNPQAPFEPQKDIVEIWGYFRKSDVKNELLYPFESVRNDFDYVAYLKLETITRNMKYVLDALDALTKNADLEIKEDLSGVIETWEQLLQVHWYREWIEYLNHLEVVVKQAIVEYKIGNELARRRSSGVLSVNLSANTALPPDKFPTALQISQVVLDSNYPNPLKSRAQRGPTFILKSQCLPIRIIEKQI